MGVIGVCDICSATPGECRAKGGIPYYPFVVGGLLGWALVGLSRSPARLVEDQLSFGIVAGAFQSRYGRGNNLFDNAFFGLSESIESFSIGKPALQSVWSEAV